MNKRDTILFEAKCLFGRYGYLGFTLKQLAQACQMTSPALYYFYSSKAELFKDCLLSELESRRLALEECAAEATNIQDFVRTFTFRAMEICGVHDFRTGQAMQEIIHLPAEMQQELREAWHLRLIAPVEAFITRMVPPTSSRISSRLMATFIINLATFSAAHDAEYSCDQMSDLLTAVANGLMDTGIAPTG